jgi:hypothetical protein
LTTDWTPICGKNHPWEVLSSRPGGSRDKYCRTCRLESPEGIGLVRNPQFIHPDKRGAWLVWSQRAKRDYERKREDRRARNASQIAEGAAFNRLMQDRGHVDFPERTNPPDIAFNQMIARNPSATDRRHCKTHFCNAMVPRGSDFCVNCQEQGWNADETGLTPDFNRVMSSYERN